MNIPSLPTDRLFKRQAFSGMVLIIASVYWVLSDIPKVVDRTRTAAEQLAVLNTEARLLNEEFDRQLARGNTSPQLFDSVLVQQRHLVVRSAALAA